MKLLKNLLIIAGAFFIQGFNMKPVADSAIVGKRVIEKITGMTVSDDVVRIATSKAEALKLFAAQKGYNTEIFFLVDMSVHSGSARFFVYNAKTGNITLSALVSHGIGSNSLTGKLTFSNEPGSLSTSIGRYAIGKPYHGKFGLAYKLFGLDATNSKAYERAVVLHATDCVPDTDIAPIGVCESFGCPIVSRNVLSTLQPIIDSSPRKILMWIYE